MAIKSTWVGQMNWPEITSGEWLVTIGLVALLVVVVFIAGYLLAQYRRKARRARLLFSANPQAILLTDDKWRIIEANVAAGRLFGYAPEQLSLLSLRRLLHTDADLEHEALEKVLAQDGLLRYEVTVVREGGGMYDISAATCRVELSGKTYLLTTLNDVTELLEDARIFRNFHEQLVDKVPIEIAVMTAQGQYLYVNEATTEGHTQLREAILGYTDVEYCQYLNYHPEIALRRRSHRREAVNNKKIVRFEEVLPSPDGPNRYFSRIYNPIVNHEGDVPAVVAYGIDQTELKQFKDQVERVLEDAERTSMLKDSFLSYVADEFSTPLTGIIGAARMLVEQQQGPQRKLGSIINRNAQHLMTTLNAMLDLSRLQADYLEMQPEMRNLVNEVKEVGRSLADVAKEKGLFLRMRATRTDVLVRVDQLCLKRVLENLIGNAIKFTETGGVLVEVDEDGEYAYVRVMDSGVGIRDGILPRLSDEANRDEANVYKNGVGIGLTVAKRLLDLIGGRIEFNTEEGQGSMFTIILPPAFPQRVRDVSVRKQVLVIDHSPETLHLIRNIVEPFMDVTTVTDLDEGLDAAQSRHYDVLLLDVEIDQASQAADVIAPFRDLQGYTHVPALALDPKGSVGEDLQYLTEGYHSVIGKPIDRQLLLEKLGDVTTPSDQTLRTVESVTSS